MSHSETHVTLQNNSRANKKSEAQVKTMFEAHVTLTVKTKSEAHFTLTDNMSHSQKHVTLNVTLKSKSHRSGVALDGVGYF